MSREFVGAGSINVLANILLGFNPQSVFIVRGKSSFQHSGAASALSRSLGSCPVTEWQDFQPNPKLHDVESAVKAFRFSRADCIIAVGGGSVLDMAKLIKYFSAIEGDFKTMIHGGAIEKDVRTIPLIAIPTTSGSGSEATHFAVIYVDRIKHSIGHHHLIPDVAIVDPDLSHGMSPYLTAVTGLDALSQAVESLWSIYSTEESRTYSRNALRLIMNHLPQAVHSPSPKNRAQMSFAAHLAGKAINITKTTAPHAISYTITEFFGIPHGHAVGLTLGACFVFNAGATDDDTTDPRGVEFVKNRMSELFELVGCDSPNHCRTHISRFIRSIGLETSWSNLGIKSQSDLELIIKNVNVVRLKNNPRRFTESDLRILIESCAATGE